MGKCTIILLVAVAVLVKLLYPFCTLLNVGKTVANHAPGPCVTINGIDKGSEDMHYLQDGITLITSGLVFMGLKGKKEFERPGRVYAFDMKHPKNKPLDVAIVGDLDLDNFNPHGITAFPIGTNGQYSVFIVNHPKNKKTDAVEKFEFDLQTMTLRHKQSITNDDFGRLNDVVAVDKDRFYASRMQYYVEKLPALFEAILQLNFGGIFYFDGSASRLVVSGLVQTNGISKSNDNTRIYAVEHFNNVLVFKIEGNGELTKEEVIHVKQTTAIDNIIVDEKGDLFLGAHPVGWQILAHMEIPGQYTAPSQVLRVRMNGVSSAAGVDEIYMDDGHRLWGSSVALSRHGGLLIGTIYNQMAYCEVKYIGA